MQDITTSLERSLETYVLNRVHTAEELISGFIGRVAALRPIILGAYLGYPVESTAYFFERQLDDSLRGSEGTVFEGTGFIPTPDQRDWPPVKLVHRINSLRFCPVAFDIRKERERPKQEGALDDAIVLLLSKNFRFVDRVNENIAVLYRYHTRVITNYLAHIGDG